MRIAIEIMLFETNSHYSQAHSEKIIPHANHLLTIFLINFGGAIWAFYDHIFNSIYLFKNCAICFL